MQAFDRRRYEMMTRVRDFGITYGDLFPESSVARKAFTVVGNAVTEIQARDVAETTASHAARVTRKKAAREALRARLVPLIKTGQALQDADPAFREQFVLPKKVRDQQLLAIAQQCLQRAATEAPRFVVHGMAPTFVADLTPLVADFEAALRDRGMNRDQLVEARAGIRQAMGNAFTALWQLDLVVANHLVSNPVAAEVWKRSRRLAYPNRRRQTTAGEPAPADVSGSELAAASGAPAPAPASTRDGTDRPSLRLAPRAA
jgi:hypothetical protein